MRRRWYSSFRAMSEPSSFQTSASSRGEWRSHEHIVRSLVDPRGSTTGANQQLNHVGKTTGQRRCSSRKCLALRGGPGSSLARQSSPWTATAQTVTTARMRLRQGIGPLPRSSRSARRFGRSARENRCHSRWADVSFVEYSSAHAKRNALEQPPHSRSSKCRVRDCVHGELLADGEDTSYSAPVDCLAGDVSRSITRYTRTQGKPCGIGADRRVAMVKATWTRILFEDDHVHITTPPMAGEILADGLLVSRCGTCILR